MLLPRSHLPGLRPRQPRGIQRSILDHQIPQSLLLEPQRQNRGYRPRRRAKERRTRRCTRHRSRSRHRSTQTCHRTAQRRTKAQIPRSLQRPNQRRWLLGRISSASAGRTKSARDLRRILFRRRTAMGPTKGIPALRFTGTPTPAPSRSHKAAERGESRPQGRRSGQGHR